MRDSHSNLQPSDRNVITIDWQVDGEKYSQWLEFLPVSIAICDRELRYLAFSRRWCRDYVLSATSSSTLERESLLGCTHSEVFPVFQKLNAVDFQTTHKHISRYSDTQWQEIYQRCLAGAVEQCEADCFLKADGSIIWVKWEIRPWYRRDGEIGGLLICTEEIRDRPPYFYSPLENLPTNFAQKPNQVLWIQQALQNAGDAISIVDKNGLLIYQNQAHQTLFGYTNTEITAVGGYSALYGDLAIAQQIFTTLNQGHSWQGDVKMVSRGGQAIHTSLRVDGIQNEQAQLMGFISIYRPSSQQSHTEAIIEDSEQRFRSTFEQAAVGMVHVSLDGTLLRVNQKFCEIVGYTREELIRHHFNEITHPDDHDVSVQAARSLLENPQVSSCAFEKRYIGKNGAIIWVNLTTSLVRNEDDNQSYFIKVVEDITERHKAAEQLRAAESRYRTLVEQIPMVTYIAAVDAAHTLLYVSPQIEKILGFSPEQWLLNSQLLRQQLHPEDSDRILAAIEHSSLTGEPLNCEFRMISRAGAVVWLSANAIVLRDQQGKPECIQGVMLDISDRKQAEAILREYKEHLEDLVQQRTAALAQVNNQLRSEIAEREQAEEELQKSYSLVRGIIHQIPDFVAIKNIDSEYVLVNHAMTQLLNKPAGEIIGKKDDAFMTQETAAMIMANDRRIINTGMTEVLEETATIAGTTRTYLSSKSPWRDSDGEIVGLICIVRDITQRKIAEETLRESEAKFREQAKQLQNAMDELKRTQGQLIQSEKMSMLGQLVAGIAHEINNPVNFIYGNLTPAKEYTSDLLGMIQLYQTEYPQPTDAIAAEIEAIDLEFLVDDLPKLLDSMQLGADRIREIVLSLRNFSRLDEADKKAVDIHAGIDSTLLILHNRLKAKPDHPPIQLIKEYGELPLVECYPGQLNQVFMNILSNAIDALDEYNEERSPAEVKANPSIITIATKLEEPSELLPVPHVIIRICDNGAGMTEQVSQNLFLPFFTTKPIGKGTGLGLAISHDIIVEKHGGKIECISAPNQGAEFRIAIPVRQTN